MKKRIQKRRKRKNSLQYFARAHSKYVVETDPKNKKDENYARAMR